MCATQMRSSAASRAFARKPNGGLIVSGSSLVVTHRNLVIALAARHKLPAIYFERNFVAAGGLVSYGPGLLDELGARAAAFENDLALMKGGEFRAMTDADDGRVCELPRQQSHQTIL